MRILVTGAAGFLGGHVAEWLLAAGHKVAAFDLAVDGRPHLRHADSICGDLLDRSGPEAACRGSDAICHLGGVGDVILAGNDPAQAASANVVGTANVVAAARAAGVSGLVYASTWEVYGEPLYQPIDEDTHAAQTTPTASPNSLASGLLWPQTGMEGCLPSPSAWARPTDRGCGPMPCSRASSMPPAAANQ